MKFCADFNNGSSSLYDAPNEEAVRKYLEVMQMPAEKVYRATADDLAWFRAYVGPAIKLDALGTTQLSDDDLMEAMGEGE